MHFRRFKLHLSSKSKIGIALLLVFFVSSSVFLTLKTKINDVLKVFAENEITNVSTYVINESIMNSFDKVNVDDLFNTVTNKNGEIISVDFNTLEVNKTLTNVNSSILKALKEIGNNNYSNLSSDIYELEKRDNGFIYYVPLGVVSGNPVVADLGPKIPIKATLNGSVFSNVRTELTEYGINNSLLKVYIEVNTSISFIMPFVSDTIKLKSEVPIITKIINGKVPEVYGSGYAISSPLSESV